MNKFTIKELQTIRDRKIAEYEGLKVQQRSNETLLATLKAEIKELNKTLNSEKITTVDPVSEHAMLRYAERVMGIDMVKIKNEILQHVYALYPYDGEVKSTINDKKYIFVVKNKRVVTVKPNNY